MSKVESAPLSKNTVPIPKAVQEKIQDAIKSIKYGTITIVVQDSHVIQIDKNEKIRLK